MDFYKFGIVSRTDDGFLLATSRALARRQFQVTVDHAGRALSWRHRPHYRGRGWGPWRKWRTDYLPHECATALQAFTRDYAEMLSSADISDMV